jgi:uncharacterized protein (DUF433 family)
MAQAKPKRAKAKIIMISPTKTTVFNPGDIIPPHIEIDGMADALSGGPVFEGTDVPVQYLFHYTDEVHNLYAFLEDFPQVSMQQALAALRERVDTNGVIHSNREIVSGTPIFKGTRVPIDILFGLLASGENIDEFLEGYPTVSREQAVEALTLAKCALENIAYETADR